MNDGRFCWVNKCFCSRNRWNMDIHGWNCHIDKIREGGYSVRNITGEVSFAPKIRLYCRLTQAVEVSFNHVICLAKKGKISSRHLDNKRSLATLETIQTISVHPASRSFFLAWLLTFTGVNKPTTRLTSKGGRLRNAKSHASKKLLLTELSLYPHNNNLKRPQKRRLRDGGYALNFSVLFIQNHAVITRHFLGVEF